MQRLRPWSILGVAATAAGFATLPDWRFFMAVLPWMVAAACFVLFVAAARAADRKSGAQFIVLRGRISCPECSYLLDLDDKHCARCGDAVAQVKKRVSCTSCRARNWEDDDYCRQCGHKKAEAPTE